MPPSIFDVVRASNPHIAYSNFEKRGYGILEVGRNGATCEFKAVDARRPRTPATTLAKFTVANGQPCQQQA